MAFGDSDLDLFFADFGVPVLFAGALVPVKGLLDDTSTELFGDRGKVLAEDRSVLVKTSDLPVGLTTGADLTVDSVAFTLRAPPAKWAGAPDGKFSLLLLVESE